MEKNNYSVALITGGSRGIGAATVKEFAKNNCHIYFTYNKNEEKANNLVEELSGISFVEAIKTDITNKSEIETTIEYILNKEEKIDFLINNAGINSDASALMMSDDKWNNVIDTNLNSIFYFSKLVGKNMIKKRSGRIVNISSVVAAKGSKGQANYIASKAAVEGLTRALAIELAPRGILVNCVAPGFIETDMTNEISDREENIIDKVLLKRKGKPEEVAKVIFFLCSDSANYITGQIITVDGGIFLNT